VAPFSILLPKAATTAFEVEKTEEFSTQKTSKNHKRKHDFHTIRTKIAEAKGERTMRWRGRSLAKNVKHTPHKFSLFLRHYQSTVTTKRNEKKTFNEPFVL
jgi:hypothetical protein